MEGPGKKRKLVVVMRTDLNMSEGKKIAQAGHAIVQNLMGQKPDVEWLATGMKKVALAIEGHDELVALHKKAKFLGLNATLVHDAGETELPKGTLTCCAIGPMSEQESKKITGSLKLL